MIFHIKKNETKNYYTNIFWLSSIVIFLKWGKKVRKWWLSVVVAICLSGFHATLAFILLISFVRLLKMSLHFLWFFYFNTNIKNKRLKKLGGNLCSYNLWIRYNIINKWVPSFILFCHTYCVCYVYIPLYKWLSPISENKSQP